MVFRRLASALGIVALAGVTGARAQDTTRVTVVTPITVTASGERGTAPPVSTSTVEGARIRRTQAQTPYDLVRRLTGIEIHEQGQGPGFASDAVLRGFTSDHSSDVLLVVDGVPINLPVHGHAEGYADWSLLVAPALRELRVIHGPASPRYGDFAFGGVVEAITDADAERTTAALTGSSYGDADGWLRTGFRRDRGGALAALDGRHQRGWRDHSDFWLGNGVLRGWRATGAGRLEGGLSLYGSRWDSPGFVSLARYDAGDLIGATDPSDGGEAARVVAHGRYTAVLGQATGFDGTAWAQAGRSTVFLNLPDEDTVSQTQERDRRVAAGAQAQLSWRLAGGDATLGGSARGDAGRYDRDLTRARAWVAPDAAYDGDYLSGALFGRWRRLVGERLVLDLGARLDAVHYGVTNRLAGAPRQSATWWIPSPKLGARVLLSGNVALLGSLSRGFRGAPGTIADPTQPPMTDWAGELGLEVETGAWHAHLAAFRINVAHERIEDPITREVSDAGTSVRQGLSADLSLHAGRRFELFAAATYNDAVMGGTPQSRAATPGLVASSVAPQRQPAPAPFRPLFHLEPLMPGERVPGVGEYVGRAGAALALGSRADARATWRCSGPFTPIGEPGVRTRPYGVLDLGAGVSLPGTLAALDLELENLLDTRYPEVRASGYLNPGEPRTLRVTLRFGADPGDGRGP